MSPPPKPDKGIAVNSWYVPVKINNARTALGISLFPSLTLHFTPLRWSLQEFNSSGFERGSKSEQWLLQFLQAPGPGPESAIFQLLSKSMCSRCSYRSPSKSAAAQMNHMSFTMALKQIWCSSLCGFTFVRRFYILHFSF